MSREVRAEFLAPAELDAALAATPVAYLPLGTLEFHGPHLPIGLDALSAHGLCVAAAQKSGGIVLPSIYQGTGGGHSDYPWTIMMPDGEAIVALITQTLGRLEQFGVKTAVLFSGHFPDEQLAMVDSVAAQWNAENRPLTVIGTGVNRCQTATLPPDHAGAFETSLLYSLWPELVHTELLPPLASNPSVDPGGDTMGLQRHNPEHALWGVFGPDPREVDLQQATALKDSLVDWLAALA
jgi:creatinine amidohydrolase